MAGRFADRFEAEFAKVFGTRFSLLVNSGSSANLLALSCLTASAVRAQDRSVSGDAEMRPLLLLSLIHI